MMGFDVGMLLNPQSLQLPDPVARYGMGLKLSDLARQQRLDELKEQELARALEAQRAYEQALPGILSGGDDALLAAIQANPQIGPKAVSEDEKRKDSQAKRRREEAAASKDVSDVAAKTIQHAGGVVNAMLESGTLNPDAIYTVGTLLAKGGIDPLQFGNPQQDPEGWATRVRDASVTADAQQRAKLDRDKMAQTKDEQDWRRGFDTQKETATRDYQNRTLGQQLTIAGMNDARARELAAATRDTAQATRDAARETAGATRINAETQAYAKMIEGTALPNLITSAKALNDTLTSYAGKKDIPGIGPVDAATPPLLRSKEGNKVRAQVQAVANDLLKLYSGGAVTANEAERRATEMMASGMFDENDLRNAWPLIVGRINAASQNVRAGFSPESVQTYETRGGMKLSPIETGASGWSARKL